MNALRVVLVGLAVIVLVTLGWRLSVKPVQVRPGVAGPPVAGRTAPPRPEAAAVSAADRQQMEAVLKDAPDLAQAFETLKADFPAVADHSLDDAVAAQRQTTTKPSADDLFGSAMRELRQRFGVLAAKAGSESLGAIFDAQAATLADLEQADPRVCADYLYGGTSPEYADFAASHRALVARYALANINAMAEGRKLQVAHGEPSADDVKHIADGLAAKGLSPDEVSALLDGKSPDPPLSDARLCANARAYLDVLRGMPPGARDRIYGLAAELLARS